MSNGFGDFVPDVKGKKRHENWAERSLEKSARELKMLRKEIDLIHVIDFNHPLWMIFMNRYKCLIPWDIIH